MKAAIASVNDLAGQWSPEDVLRWAFTTYQQHFEIASGFGVEGVVLIDIAARLQPDLRVFTVDTGFLFPETYALIERIEKRYRIQVERLRSELTPEAQKRQYGAALWSRNPDACCTIRKTTPLRNKLASLKAWATSIRRDQTQFRKVARKVEWDRKFLLVKINPLADWTSEEIWTYVRKHDVPYNILHDRDYPSIGCMPCTRRVKPGEDARSGRWPGFTKTECGLHG